jgi:hypothetical protein
MSSFHLPQDITDYILDHLHDQPETLMQCCLVSRSWIQASRKHLFGQVSFNSSTLLERWERAFPDPLNSPVIHTCHLVVNGPNVFAKVPGECDWTQAFSRVGHVVLYEQPTFSLPLTTSHHSRTPLHSCRAFITLTHSQDCLFPTLTRGPEHIRLHARRLGRRLRDLPTFDLPTVDRDLFNCHWGQGHLESVVTS